MQQEAVRHTSGIIIWPSGSIKIPNKTKADVWDKTNGYCYYCGIKIHPFRNFSVDHFLSKLDGGSHELENLVLACKHCNAVKGYTTIEEFREYLMNSGATDGRKYIFYFENNKALNGV